MLANVIIVCTVNPKESLTYIIHHRSVRVETLIVKISLIFISIAAKIYRDPTSVLCIPNIKRGEI